MKLATTIICKKTVTFPLHFYESNGATIDCISGRTRQPIFSLKLVIAHDARLYSVTKSRLWNAAAGSLTLQRQPRSNRSYFEISAILEEEEARTRGRRKRHRGFFGWRQRRRR